MIVDIVGLFYAQSTFSGSGIKFGCSVYYRPFDLVVGSFIFQLPTKFWQIWTLFSVFWIVHVCSMSRKSAFECLRSGSYINSILPSSVITSAWYITFSCHSLHPETLILCANTGLHLFLCFRIKDSSIVPSNPLLHVRHAAIGQFNVVPIDFAMMFIPHWKWFINCPQKLIP